MLTTLGVELFKKIVNIDGTFYQLKIWDTCGQERLRALTTNYYRNADGVILLFDVTQKDSFNNLEKWVASLKEKVVDSLPLVIVGNKIDLPNKTVTPEMIKDISQQYNVKTFETSAKSGKDSSEPFLQVASEVIESKKLRKSIFTIKEEKKNKSKCCLKS